MKTVGYVLICLICMLLFIPDNESDSSKSLVDPKLEYRPMHDIMEKESRRIDSISNLSKRNIEYLKPRLYGTGN